MKQRLFIFGVLLLLVVAMIGLNAASYIQKPKEPDNELSPNRSSYNSGSTGSMAFYTLLAESGRNVRRWQLPIASLEARDKNTPSTFVIVGPLKRAFTEDEYLSLESWIAAGGRLIVIDRDPESELVSTTMQWHLEITPSVKVELLTVDPADQTQMTAGTPAVKPSQISWLTAGVNAIQPSRFASTINYERFEAERYVEVEDVYQPPPPPPAPARLTGGSLQLFEQWAVPTATPMPPPPPPAKAPATGEQPNYTLSGDGNESEEEDNFEDPYSPEVLSVPKFAAPLTHFSDQGRDLVVEVGYGGGSIVYVADPFIISNGGISMADNVQFALNLAGNGNIAFDEFHQGFGTGNNRILEYFQGTPLVAIILQILAIVAVVLYSRSRRFARFVPEPEPNRLTKLEYVEAMADIQRRTKAYDLAIENIYTDFRRRVSRSFGLGNALTPRHELAEKIAERIGLEREQVEALMAKCEDVIHGEPASRATVLTLAAGLRSLEEKLNLSRKPRTRI